VPFAISPPTRAAAALAAAAWALAGCSSSAAAPDVANPAGPSAGRAATASPSGTAAIGRPIPLPPLAAGFDYQLGGAYPPPAGVEIVSRDSGASPAPGVYNVCYINAFQAQPDATDWWRANHADLLLRSKDGSLVIDKNWNEALLDVSTDAKRAALARIEDGWIDACAKKGFQAVEPDNLDSYSRSDGQLTMDENVAFAGVLARRAHEDGVAIAQKNAAELLDRRRQIGFDFAVVEQCGTYDECGQYAAAYADRVLDIEYDDDGLSAACGAWRGKLSIVERDLDVSPPDSSAYVYQTC
jgi:hypothetical protein